MRHVPPPMCKGKRLEIDPELPGADSLCQARSRRTAAGRWGWGTVPRADTPFALSFLVRNLSRLGACVIDAIFIKNIYK